MPAASEVSFELERFEWTADDRLEVVGRWKGVSGRRIGRPALTIESGGRRRRVSGSQVSDDPWSAAFTWSGGEIAGAELELGRSLVVELPPPRRRRRRGTTGELRTQVDELRMVIAQSEAERERLAAALAARPEVETVRSAAAAEIDALRSAAAESAAELDALRPAAAERDRLAAELDALRAATADLDALRTAAGERDRLAAELEALRVDAADLEALRADAGAAGERDRLVAELEALRADAGERDRLAAEVERLREAAAESERELAGLRLAHGSLKAAHDGLEDELEQLRGRSVRDPTEPLRTELEAERAVSRDLRRELDELRTEERPPEPARRRVDAARAAASTRMPKAAPSPYALWAVRIAAALLVAALGVALVILVSLAT